MLRRLAVWLLCAGRARELLQQLLADRFGLRVHHESKEMPVYALVVGTGGPKMAARAFAALS